jgi:hypothetical protein
MRILLHRLAHGVDVCPRLGIVFAPPSEHSHGRGRAVRFVFPSSPAEAAGLGRYDIVLAVDGRPLSAIQHIVLSEHRPSSLRVNIWSPRYFRSAHVTLRVEPEPFAPIDVIVAAAELHLELEPQLPEARFLNPHLLARHPRRRRRSP